MCVCGGGGGGGELLPPKPFAVILSRMSHENCQKWAMCMYVLTQPKCLDRTLHPWSHRGTVVCKYVGGVVYMGGCSLGCCEHS